MWFIKTRWTDDYRPVAVFAAALSLVSSLSLAAPEATLHENSTAFIIGGDPAGVFGGAAFAPVRMVDAYSFVMSEEALGADWLTTSTALNFTEGALSKEPSLMTSAAMMPPRYMGGDNAAGGASDPMAEWQVIRQAAATVGNQDSSVELIGSAGLARPLVAGFDTTTFFVTPDARLSLDPQAPVPEEDRVKIIHSEPNAMLAVILAFGAAFLLLFFPERFGIRLNRLK